MIGLAGLFLEGSCLESSSCLRGGDALVVMEGIAKASAGILDTPRGGHAGTLLQSMAPMGRPSVDVSEGLAGSGVDWDIVDLIPGGRSMQVVRAEVSHSASMTVGS